MQRNASSSSGSKLSATRLVAEKLSSGMRSVTHAFSGKRSTTSLSDAASSQTMGVDTDALTQQVISQFGQLVETVGAELPPVISRKRRDTEILKVSIALTSQARIAAKAIVVEVSPPSLSLSPMVLRLSQAPVSPGP